MWANRTLKFTAVELLALSTTWVTALTASGLQASQTSQTKLSLPSSGQLLELTVDAPQEVKVGETFQLKATLENTSSSVDVHDIQLEAQISGPVEIQTSKIKQSSQGQSHDSSTTNDGSANQRGQSGQSSKQQSRSQASSSSASEQQSQDNNQPSEEADSEKKSWTIKTLAAGESAEIILQAVGDGQEEAECCLALKSFRITSNAQPLCATTKFVKPELQITKQAPERATLCDVIGFVYVVKNGGTGDVGPFTVEDKLPEGFATESGDKQLKFEVDGLKAGEERKFEAKIRPMKIGEFSSRAVARVHNSDLSSQSSKATTKVEGPELAVAIDGPETAPARELVEYTVRITNKGNQAVDRGILEIAFPSTADLRRQGGFNRAQQEASAGTSQSGQPEEAAKENGSQSLSRQSSAAKSREKERDRRTVEFSGLHPGDTIRTSFAMKGMEEETIRVTAKASYQCRTSDGQESVTSSEATTQTRIVAMPALLVTVVDEQDPIQIGKHVVYKIVIQNQGNTADKNLQVEVELPESLKFEDASGETSAQNNGQQVTFDKIDQLPAGEAAEWTLKAKAASQGEARIKVKVNSDGLKETVETQEPTQLYGEQVNANVQNSSAGNSQD